MKSDIKISQAATLWPITKVANEVGLTEEEIECYGRYKAKINDKAWENMPTKEGKLILVTATNPTPSGEGKSTVSIGLADALRLEGKNATLALREPSLGPVMGIKGGATGGGYSQVVPMEDINLHFTGDIHAITTANNALAALIDNHIQQGNELGIDVRKILWKRCVDLNDRALRHVVVGLGGPMQGVPREDGFDITVASEIMAILCLATSLSDLKERLSNILIGYNYDNEPVYVRDLKVEGALTVLLKDAFQPNLVQTLAHTPTFIHGGPFANIAHGCNSIMATKVALRLGDYTVTEAGFGADLGGEKFLDIVSERLDHRPEAIVLVSTIRSLKYNGGVAKEDLTKENLEALEKGSANLAQHIQSLTRYQVPVVVALNRFVTDTEAEIAWVKDFCARLGVVAVDTEVWAKGGEGGRDLAKAVIAACEEKHEFSPLYTEADSLEEKIRQIVIHTYGGKDFVLTTEAQKQLAEIKAHDWDHLPICMAKTQYSLSDQPEKLGAPKDFTITIRSFIPKLGAGFIVALTGTVLTMPGLPKKPAALNMDVDENGKIKGLF